MCEPGAFHGEGGGLGGDGEDGEVLGGEAPSCGGLVDGIGELDGAEHADGVTAEVEWDAELVEG